MQIRTFVEVCQLFGWLRGNYNIKHPWICNKTLGLHTYLKFWRKRSRTDQARDTCDRCLQLNQTSTLNVTTPGHTYFLQKPLLKPGSYIRRNNWRVYPHPSMIGVRWTGRPRRTPATCFTCSLCMKHMVVLEVHPTRGAQPAAVKWVHSPRYLVWFDMTKMLYQLIFNLTGGLAFHGVGTLSNDHVCHWTMETLSSLWYFPAIASSTFVALHD